MRPQAPMSESKAPAQPLYKNIVSLLGFLVVVASATLTLFAMIAQLTMGHLSPYVGIITYLIFPGIMATGVATILFGMRWEAGRRRRQADLETLPYPQIDLNETRQRRMFAYVVVGGTFASAGLAWAAYNGYLYTEEVEFCGALCHTVMEPEYTAYQNSAHARVPCVECHVGEGAGWYVKSKLSGARQVLAVTFNTYQTPIPTPIQHLRPARETCERCHWPEKFFGATLLQIPHYRYDEPNTAEQISLTLKTGGGSKSHGESAGIHWHMVVDNRISFAAADEKLQQIPWTRVLHADGSTTDYVARNAKLSRAEIDALPRRTMDCMDCHNRPSHEFPIPDSSIDQALFRGKIARSLPWIKKLTVDALMKGYPNRETAHAGIREHIEGVYRQRFPDVLKKQQQDVEQAIEATIDVYDRGVFPAMKVDWTTYPSNIGHRYWPGCFRCHDGQHVSAEGKVLVMDCSSTCHTAPQRGSVTPLGELDPFAGQDWHPWEMPAKHVEVEGHKNVLCHECHRAGQRPKKDCRDCHGR